MIPLKHAGIFAAGLGTRFAKKFPGIPKPMIPVLNKPLLEWTVRFLSSAGLENFTILLNSKGSPAKEHLKKVFPNKKFIFVIKDTASSYESFRLVSQMLSQTADSFILSAVDSLHKPSALKELTDFTADNFDAAITITDNIKDQKPLWADIDGNGRITALGDWTTRKKYATGGLYLMTKKLAGEMPLHNRFNALREYLTELVLEDKKIFSVLTDGSADVDTPADIAIAENFIKENLTKSEIKYV